MKETVQIIFIGLILLIPWLFIIVYLLAKNRQIIKNFKSLESKYGLQVDYGDRAGFKRHPKSSGFYRNKPVSIISSLKTEGGKKFHSTLVKVTSEKPYSLQFTVASKNKLNKSLYKNQSVSLNDHEFDDNFIVVTNDIESIKKIFNFNSKFKLQQALGLGFKGEIRFDGINFEYHERKLMNTETDLMRTELILHELCDLADELKHI